jgi:hypothetical protein
MARMTVAVLGMHHSGTTCLAEAVIASGVHFGAVRQTNEHDPIVLLHAQMTCWNDPVPATPTAVHRAERDRIIRTFSSSTRWGFKDPVTLFTLGLWREVLDVELVGTFRDPRKVIRRLRLGVCPESVKERFWRRYNEQLLRLHAEVPFPIVSFDSETYARDVERAIGRGVSLFDPRRPNTATYEGPLSTETEDLHAELLRRSIKAEGESSASG